MDVTSITSSNGMQYEVKIVLAKKDKERLENDPKNKELGVIVEISKESEEALKMSRTIKKRVHEQTRREVDTSAHRVISGNSVDGMVSFYGASVTQEQCHTLQNVIKELEEQGYVKTAPDGEGSLLAGDEALGNSWEPGTYAQLGLKVSQLSYACKEMGLSDEVAEQISGTYRKQTEEKINKVNDLVDALKTQMEVETQKLDQMIREKGGEGAYERYVQAAKNRVGEKDSVEYNQEVNADIYKMFSNLDISNADSFKNSFQNALNEFYNYFAKNPIEDYTGTEQEKLQIDTLVSRFNNFLSI